MTSEQMKNLRLQAKHLTAEQIALVPESTWYKYTLHCRHEVYSKVRIRVPRLYHEHFIRCPKCQRIGETPLNWQPVELMEAVTDEHVSNVLDGSAFVVPKRILRTAGHDSQGYTIPDGNPFPYSVRDSDY
jgi:hypothetical protein